MDTGFYKKLENPLGLAVIDLIPCLIPKFPNTNWISRVHVPAAHRNKGIGTELMKAACEQADAEKITLMLEPSPYANAKENGGLNYTELKAWYESLGFKVEKVKGYGSYTFMIRRPK